MKTREEWRNIKGYEGLYCVSNLGRVKSLARKCKAKGNSFRNVGEKILKSSKNSNGYYYVELSNNGRAHSKRVRVLVTWAFIRKGDSFIRVGS